MKKMSDYMFHIGLQMRTYPSDRKKAMIRMNDGASRFVHSCLVTVYNEMFHLKKSTSLSEADARRFAYPASVYGDAKSIRNAIQTLLFILS